MADSKSIPITTLKSTIAFNLNYLMQQNGKSRKQICDDLDIKYTTFTDWVNGKTYPRLESLEILGFYFNVGITEFFVEPDSRNVSDKQNNRLIQYASKLIELDPDILPLLSDNQARELVKRGFRFRHRTLEEYIERNGGNFTPSPEVDWGEPKGREIW